MQEMFTESKVLLKNLARVKMLIIKASKNGVMLLLLNLALMDFVGNLFQILQKIFIKNKSLNFSSKT